MYDFEHEPAPIDSYDLYAMGLRAPRCNGCSHAKLKWELGDRYYRYDSAFGVAVYERGKQPAPGQGEPLKIDGEPIEFRASYMSIGHSDECYNWTPPQEKPEPEKKGWFSRMLGR